jgi:enoyl-CoA hydratase/carnithine racemase
MNQETKLYPSSFNPLFAKSTRPVPKEIGIIGAGTADSLSGALEIEYQGSAEIACTDAAKEGISAFLQKRKPEFKK